MHKIKDNLYYCGPKEVLNPNYRLKFPTANGKPQILLADLDSTLVVTNSGRKHPKNPDDWTWIEGALEKIQACTARGIPVIVISNQAGIVHSEKKKTTRKDLLLRRILNISGEAGETVQFWVAGDYDNYRKPCTGIFEEYIFVQAPDCENWVFIGDAAGREGDHSDSDRKFAYNINLLLSMKSANRAKLLERVHSRRTSISIVDKPTGEGSSTPVIKVDKPAINEEEAKLLDTVNKMPIGNLDSKKGPIPQLTLPKSSTKKEQSSSIKNEQSHLELRSPVSAKIRAVTGSLAIAAKISFLTPEEFIYKESPRTRQFNGFDPKAFLASLPKNAETNQNLLLAKIKQLLLDRPSLLIMIGYPATGKSTMAAKMADSNIQVIHKDLATGNIQNQIVDNIKAGKSVILDATNPKKIGRMTVCQDVKMRTQETPIYYLIIHSNIDVAKHMNRWRAWLTNVNNMLPAAVAFHKKPIPAPAFFNFMNSYQEPTTDEGVTQIFNTSVVPVFTSEESKARFLQLSE